MDPVTSSSLENSIYFDPAGGQDASPSRQSRNLSSVNSITSDRTVRGMFACAPSTLSWLLSHKQLVGSRTLVVRVAHIRLVNGLPCTDWDLEVLATEMHVCSSHFCFYCNVANNSVSQAQSSMQGQDHDESSVPSSPGIPPPPSPDNLWVSVTCKKILLGMECKCGSNKFSAKKTAFLNYISGNRKQSKVEFKTYNKGEPHSPEWTAICKCKYTTSGNTCLSGSPSHQWTVASMRKL